MKIRADHIKQALSERHKDDFFLTEVKTGATWNNNELLKFDAYAVKKSWANPCLTGYEVKVSRNDFMQDNKWPGYLAYCNKFSFVCPTGLIQPEELPEEVGLIYYNHEKGTLYTKRAARFRIIEHPNDLYFYLLLSRLDSDRHPFFGNSRTEFIEAYLEDKARKRELGYKFGTKLVLELQEARDQLEDADRRLERTKDEREMFGRVRAILKEVGIEMRHWNHWEDDLRNMLKAGMPSKVVDLAQQMKKSAEQLLEIAKVSQEVDQ